MFTSAELIEALRRRTRRSLRPETPAGEFPPGWQSWFADLRRHLGSVSGAKAEAFVALLMARELRARPRRSMRLNRWQAFNTLWRQQWHPVGAEARWQRIMALTIAVVSQLLFALFVIWLAYARYGGEPVPLGEDVVQVEFIGDGTPVDEGGGKPSGARPQPKSPADDSSSPAASRATAAVPPHEQPSDAAPAQPALAQSEAVPQPPVPVETSQPLQVTEVAEPDAALVVPPTRQRSVQLPQASIEVPTLQTQPEALPSPAPPMPAAVMREVRLQTQNVRVPGLNREAESLPAPGPPLPRVAERQLQQREGKVSAPGLKASADSLSSSASSPGAASGSAPASGVSGAAAAVAPGASSTQAQGNGAGPKSTSKPGAWTSPKAGDDWGLSDRNRDGGQRGASSLFDENGRPRIPPMVVTENIKDLDRAGTWLKRPPNNYSPTMFDRYWLPGENLLQEWVRRGVREVMIPVPGTSKKIRCVVSILQLGGGCGVTDPDMQDQEAGARPPPDVPWKPELQDR
ncbi:MAG: hypothetical protein ABIR05_01980 [Luteimonas sp.]